MKITKIGLIFGGVALMSLTAGATIYNTGYSVSVNGSGQLVDNLWTVTALANTNGISLPAPPYSAFVLPSPTITWPWDTSQAPAGANTGNTQWDSNQQPAFGGSDTAGMITTYTLNFTAPVGAYSLYFEDDNYVQMYLGAVSPANLFYSELPAHNGTDFLGWQNTTVNVTTAGANQLNILVYNYPYPTGNYTGLRVNFATTTVPEPSTMALMAGGVALLFGAIKRRK